MAVGFTRRQMREEVAREFGYNEGGAESGSLTTVVDTKLSRFADNYFETAQAFIVETTDGLAPQGDDASFVTGFDRATGVATVYPPFSAAVGAGDVYQFFTNVFTWQIHGALKLACAGAQVVTNLVPSTTQLDYVLTGAARLYRLQQLQEVWIRTSNDMNVMPYRVKGWETEDAEGCLTLRLPYLLSADDALWITYYAGEDALADDTTLINLPLSLVKARAVVNLLQMLLHSQNSSGQERIGSRLRLWQENLAAEERKYQRPTGRVVQQLWQGSPATDRAFVALGLT